MVAFPLSPQWTDLESLNAAKLTARIDAPLNTLPRGFLGESNVSSTTTLTTTSGVAATGSFVFTLPDQRRVRLAALCQFQMVSGTNGQYFLSAVYNTGNTVSVGSAVIVGPTATSIITATGLRDSRNTEGTVLLAAGTYTAYCLVQRASGGGTTDLARVNYINAFDVGAT